MYTVAVVMLPHPLFVKRRNRTAAKARKKNPPEIAFEGIFFKPEDYALTTSASPFTRIFTVELSGTLPCKISIASGFSNSR